MDTLFSTFLSVFLAEMGDRTQILAAALALRYHKNGPVLAGLACATMLNCLISAAAGSVIAAWISEVSLDLLAGLTYIFAGAGILLWRRKVDPLTGWKTPAFLTAFLGLFILEFGDKSQFIIAAQGARTEIWGMTAVGGFAGIMTAAVPAVILRERLAALVPLKPIRWAAGALLLGWGFLLAFQAPGLA